MEQMHALLFRLIYVVTYRNHKYFCNHKGHNVLKDYENLDGGYIISIFEYIRLNYGIMFQYKMVLL